MKYTEFYVKNLRKEKYINYFNEHKNILILNYKTISGQHIFFVVQLMLMELNQCYKDIMSILLLLTLNLIVK